MDKTTTNQTKSLYSGDWADIDTFEEAEAEIESYFAEVERALNNAIEQLKNKFGIDKLDFVMIRSKNNVFTIPNYGTKWIVFKLPNTAVNGKSVSLSNAYWVSQDLSIGASGNYLNDNGNVYVGMAKDYNTTTPSNGCNFALAIRLA